ncbi:MAG: hypothetical protein ACK5UG_13760 [Synechococcaceae cyanobacterium]
MIDREPGRSSCLWCRQPLRLPPAGRPILTCDWGATDTLAETLYAYVPCGHCRSLVLVNPPPAEAMGRHYRNDYEPYETPQAASLAPAEAAGPGLPSPPAPLLSGLSTSSTPARDPAPGWSSRWSCWPRSSF